MFQTYPKKNLTLLIALQVFFLLSGCGTQVSDVLPDRKVDYKKQKVAEQDLEVPPDLTRDSINDTLPVPGIDNATTYSEFEQQRRTGRRGSITKSGDSVLPEVENVQIMKDGNQRWLVIDAPPDDVWPRVVSFWRENGVLLVEQNPGIGVMKTDWLENRADVKNDFITDFFRKSLDSVYSSGTRDQFRVRLEPGERSGTTDLFLTHRGLEEVFQKGTTGEDSSAYWKSRPNDPGLESAMLRRLMIHLGVAEKKAERALTQVGTRDRTRSNLVKTETGSALLVQDYFASSWRLVGLALERVGFAVEDRDRTAGIYYVRYDDPTQKEEKGFFSKLAFWSDDSEFDKEIQYQVSLREDADITRVQVLNSKGVLENSDTGVRILTLIQENIR